MHIDGDLERRTRVYRAAAVASCFVRRINPGTFWPSRMKGALASVPYSTVRETLPKRFLGRLGRRSGLGPIQGVCGTTLPEPALSAHFCQPSHRTGVSALTGYDPPVRCATWHTYGPAPMRGTEPVNRRSPPPEARQRRDHQVAARRASSAFTSTSAKICQAILGGRSQCSTDPSPCRSARQLPSVPSSDRRAGPHEGAATP